MSSLNLKFETQFNIAVRAMRINGSYPFLKRNLKWWIHFSFVYTIKIFCTTLICYSILCHDIINKNYVEATKNASVALICFASVMKYFALIYYKRSVISLVSFVDEDYEKAKQSSPEEQNIVKEYAMKGRYLSIFWFFCAVSGVLVFPLLAAIKTVQSFRAGENRLILMFDLTLPASLDKHKDKPGPFCLYTLLSMVYGLFGGGMYIGFDPLLPIFTLHVGGQLEILKRKMGRALAPHESIEIRKENLKLINIKLQKLYHFVDVVRIVFTIVNEFNMKTTTILIPLIMMNLFQGLRNDNTINIEFVVLLAAEIFHFLLPCYFSDKLMDKDQEFREAIYNSGWELEPNTSIRRTILLMLMRASRPMRISTVFTTMCLDTFAIMMQQAYTLFNLMNAAWS